MQKFTVYQVPHVTSLQTAIPGLERTTARCLLQRLWLQAVKVRLQQLCHNSFNNSPEQAEAFQNYKFFNYNVYRLFQAVLRIRMFLGLRDPAPDQIVRGTDPSIMKQK